MRLIPLALAALLLLIQYPLWLGKGGWLHVKDMEAQVAAVHQKNDELRARNAKLDSEVRDLKDGTEAVEERARVELGMIKQNEVFVQVVGPAPAGAPGASAPAPAAVPPGASGAAPAPVAPTAPPAPLTPSPAGASHR